MVVMQIEAIVPAYNEAATISAVVQALCLSNRVSRVIVVDDGSRDGTGDLAGMSGAEVIRIYPNGGKGKGMLRALRATTSEYVGFFDADLFGLLPNHVDRIVDTAELGFDMVCGLRDYGSIGNAIQIAGPIITGERVCRRAMLEKIPISCWSGYAIETAMNSAIKRNGYRTACIMLDGVSIKNKVSKSNGFWKGMYGHIKMISEIMETSRSLEKSCGTSCSAK
jgi:glycosyltransferase involved in cell wall biosynthesis